MDNNSHTLFIVNAAVGDKMDPDSMPLYESYRLGELAENLVPGDYEGIASLTITESGDCLDIEVTYHITTDGLVDVEPL